MSEAFLMTYQSLKILCFMAVAGMYIFTWRKYGYNDRETGAYLIALVGWGFTVGLF